MEEIILKCAEFGVLGVIVLILLTKGLTSLNELAKTTATLSESQKALAETISKLTEKVAGFGFQIDGIERRLDKLEELYSRSVEELRNLIKSHRRKE